MVYAPLGEYLLPSVNARLMELGFSCLSTKMPSLNFQARGQLLNRYSLAY